MKKLLLVILSFLFVQNIVAQDYSPKAQAFFSGYLSARQMLDLAGKSLPTRSDCALVFQPEAAETYFAALPKLRQQIALSKIQSEAAEKFVQVRVHTFSAQDIALNKQIYAGGMARIADKLQPYVLFYEIEQIRDKTDKMGVLYQFWVRIDGRWVYFPKPYSIF